jgi:transcriptional regulator with XRE-family HTH domain
MLRRMENRVRVRRAEKRVTQFEIATKTAIGQTRLSRIENGLIEPTADEIDALVRVLDTTREELFPTLAEQQRAEA